MCVLRILPARAPAGVFKPLFDKVKFWIKFYLKSLLTIIPGIAEGPNQGGGLVWSVQVLAVGISFFSPPLASLLLALDNPTVNYLSLDLEGAELQVLCCWKWCQISLWFSGAIGPFFGSKRFQFQVIRTIPFNQLDIEVLSVEFNLLGRWNISLNLS